MPGTGALDLAGLLAALPASIPITVEVQSDHLAASLTAGQRAQLAMNTTSTLLGGTAG